MHGVRRSCLFFFFNDTATTEIYTLSLHDALPIYVAARRAARAVFAGELRRESHVPIARVSDALAVQATPDGAACALYGAGFTELLRLLVGFEGAMLHISCRATGGEVCGWRGAPPP